MVPRWVERDIYLPVIRAVEVLDLFAS